MTLRKMLADSKSAPLAIWALTNLRLCSSMPGMNMRVMLTTVVTRLTGTLRYERGRSRDRSPSARSSGAVLMVSAVRRTTRRSTRVESVIPLDRPVSVTLRKPQCHTTSPGVRNACKRNVISTITHTVLSDLKTGRMGRRVAVSTTRRSTLNDRSSQPVP